MGMKNIVDKVEKVDDYTVRFALKRPEAPFLADMAMDFASILSKEYFETMMKKGTPNAADVYPIGTGPFEFVSYQKDATIRYKAFDQLLERPAEDRQPGLLDHARRHRALREAEDRRMPRDGVPEARRSRRDAQGPAAERAAEGRPQRRLHRVQRREEAVRQQARAPGAQHGDQQGSDPEGGLPGPGPGREEPDPADPVELQQRRAGLPVRSREGEAAARAGRLSRTASRSTSGTCR